MEVRTNDGDVVLRNGNGGVIASDITGAVEVTNRFDRRWSRGFEVVEIVSAGYRLRRLSDGTVIPAVFVPNEVRADVSRPAPFRV